MKAPKISLDSAKIQAFLLQHVEKIVLVVVVGLVGWFVYQGIQLEGLPPESTPPLLMQKGTEVIAFIDNPVRWSEVSSDIDRVAPMDVVKQVEDAQLPNDSGKYVLLNRFSLPDHPKRTFRTDPKIYPPIHLKVVAIQGPQSVYPKGTEVDPLSHEKVEAPPATAVKAKAPKTARKGRYPKGGGEGALAGGEGPPRPQPGRMEGPFGQGGAAGVATVNPESIRGYQAEGEGAIARNLQAMVVMAVVPIEKQIQEFENSLASSLDYDSARDMPQYLAYSIERADVTANPAADPATLTWAKLNPAAALKETEEWEGVLTEIVDPAYLHAVLTHPAPPLMQRDIWELLTHPDVPLATVNLDEAADAPPEEAVPTDDVPLSPVPMPTAGGPEGQVPVGPRYPRPAVGEQAGPRGPRRPPVGVGEGPGMAAAKPAAPPKFQLIRFTDTSVEAGKQYRYRVKVFVHDPNHPATGYTLPSIVSLRDDVQRRIKDLDTADAKTGKRTYWVTSEWSEASASAILPTTRHYFAGKVTPPKTRWSSKAAPKCSPPSPRPRLWRSCGPATRWSMSRPSTMRFVAPFYNFTSDTKVIHPVTHQVIDLKFTMRTDAIVVDIQGGERIPPVEKRNEHPLESPGEVLIFDLSGKLYARDESYDVEGYRLYVVPKPEVKKVTSPTDQPGVGGGLEDLLNGPAPPRSTKSKKGG